MAQNPSEGKLIYHITHINNLPSILKVGLLSRKKLLRNPSLSFTDIADSEILSKREQYKEALSQYVPWIEKSCDFVNTIETNHELECLATICFLIESSGGLTEDQVVSGFKNWSEDKAQRFSSQEILEGVQKLYSFGIIEKSLIGYNLVA